MRFISVSTLLLASLSTDARGIGNCQEVLERFCVFGIRDLASCDDLQCDKREASSLEQHCAIYTALLWTARSSCPAPVACAQSTFEQCCRPQEKNSHIMAVLKQSCGRTTISQVRVRAWECAWELCREGDYQLLKLQMLLLLNVANCNLRKVGQSVQILRRHLARLHVHYAAAPHMVTCLSVRLADAASRTSQLQHPGRYPCWHPARHTVWSN